MRNNVGQASGWLAKARRHLEPTPQGLIHGYVLLTEAVFSMFAGQLDAALGSAGRALEMAAEASDPDLRALSLGVEGYCLSILGREREARPKLDEAMASAIGGELGPFATGFVYCRTVCASLDVLDFQRALEWTDAIEQAGADPCMAGFSGDCRAHRASIYVMRGDWQAGEREARTASAESRSLNLGHAGIAENEVGILRLRAGDLDGAQAAFLEAHQLGHTPQPGLALLHLARGELDKAESLLRSALEHTPQGTPVRARLLPALFETAMAQTNLAAAEGAHRELAAIAAVHTAPALRAAAATMAGVLLLAQGDARAACDALRPAVSLWLQAGAPYETAGARLELARALTKLGDAAAAELEITAAIHVLRRLGAQPAVARAQQMIPAGAPDA
jgi:tetratricopeptide (TPR) repeat protein